jgi:hypothetical protein
MQVNPSACAAKLSLLSERSSPALASSLPLPCPGGYFYTLLRSLSGDITSAMAQSQYERFFGKENQ